MSRFQTCEKTPDNTGGLAVQIYFESITFLFRTVQPFHAAHNELDVADYTVTDDGITVILKGSLGEMWASKLCEAELCQAK